MEVGKAQGLLAAVTGIDVACADLAEVTAAVRDLQQLRSFLDGRAVAFARRLAEVSPTPERVLAHAARTSPRSAERVLERAAVIEQVPPFGDALDGGRVSGDHVDVVGRGLRGLGPALRPQLASAADRLVALAETVAPPELDRAVKAEIRRIQTDDGVSRLERQRRNTRLRTWIDGDGMFRISGQFDPETGVRMDGRLRAAMAARFAEPVPELAPSDPGERHDFLRALALVALIEGTGPAAGRPEVVVVLDTTQPDPNGYPAIDWGLPVELPVEVLRDLFAIAHVHPVVVWGGIVIHAPGTLNLGRTTRLANRAQRRALRALYPTCAMPGCRVRFDACDIHHVRWWEPPHCGPTDLDNLVPLCDRHHHGVHDLGWLLKLAPDRTLTIVYPDHTTETTGPPRRNPPLADQSAAVPMRR